MPAEESKSIQVYALTGGVGTGKTTFCRLLRELLPAAAVFDCDASVAGLLQRADIRERIRAALGPGVEGEGGGLSRDRLRDLVFREPDRRRELESILHPLVREECLAARDAAARDGGSPIFVADVPLLYESGFDFGAGRTLLVATSRATQRARLKSRDNFDDTLAEAILAAQLPIEDKIPLADVVFWNEGPEGVLRSQILRFLQTNELMSDEETKPPAGKGDESATPESSEPASVETVPKPDIPKHIDCNEFRERPLGDLVELAATLPIRTNAAAGKGDLIFEILSYYANEGAHLEVEGVVEQAKENYGMIRDPKRSFKTSPDDCYIGGKLIKEHDLRAGQWVRASLRGPRDRDKYLSALEIISIEGIPIADCTPPKDFDSLTSLFPEERFHLERPDDDALAVRLLDLVAPLGKGQRGLIVAPPRGGKTILLKQIAKSIEVNHPETKLIILLLDERPEEVTDFEEAVSAPVYASTFDEPSKRHAQVSDLVLERARRLVESGNDVVIMLDSLT
ncbi:MAG: dephospho-CoA kinase, partial [Akkermansiaceae bacterium]|nr:dephospho-CoA kinase [Akkermansiaceae bacterium]